MINNVCLTTNVDNC